MTLLSLLNISVTRRDRAVLNDVSFSVGRGELVGVVGPNGAGKTTLMRAALGLIAATGNSSLANLTPRAKGQTAAWLPQSREIAWPVTVETLVMLGRIPHLGAGQKAGADDHAAVERALERMDLTGLRSRTATRLSGGEQARVLIARTLAQETQLLMADEPIAGLDPAHQIATMQSFGDLAREGRSILVSLHDLGLAARHCTRLIVLDHGAVVADGTPEAVLSPALLRTTFGISAFQKTTPDGMVFQPLEVVI